MLSCLVLYSLSKLGCGIDWKNILYFVIGFTLKSFKFNLTEKTFKSYLYIIPIVLITCFNENYDRDNFTGLGLSIFILLFLISTYSCVPKIIQKATVLLGVNSLSIVLFSPFMTPFTNVYRNFFSFDPTNIIWALFSTFIVIIGCLLAAIVLDNIKLSSLILGKNLYVRMQ